MNLLSAFLVILLLVVLNAVFAMGELALVSVRRARLAVLVRNGVPGATQAAALAEDPHRFLPTVQVGITLVSIIEGTFGGAKIGHLLTPYVARVPWFAPFASEIALGVTVVAITYLMLVLGELVPKQLALRRPERIAAALSRPLGVLSRLTAPAVWVLGRSSALVLRGFGISRIDPQTVTEEELRALIAEGAAAGVLETEERAMIERLLRLADKPVRAIMTPRNELAWIERNASRREIARVIKTVPHSRLVVCEGGIDNPVGVIWAKDILDMLLDGGDISINAVLRQPVVIPETISALVVLERLRADPLGLALVLDEYGGFEGLVTAADVFAAIVGQPPKPHSLLPEAPVEGAPAEFTLDGTEPIDEIRDRLGIESVPAEGTYHTLAGLVLALLHRVPATGDKVAYGGWSFEVLEMDGRRVQLVRVVREALAA
ncbi:putative hemolysin [Endobacter medicaginis]|uniref:HlyC/CorC family transporter n=1 Tax=Endobacter medicaginis TaxID=1181271 RepID=A0A850NL07_9PROT|nr:hemolysin family protein [Endobacter medicaginis]MBB3173856.1 putative hemolysin [Endobacter medicaginis]MCX5476138.1 hemolysin family protein [Endobacter medicaginis]NVN29159.1 HlyC/CorC family transporter [Endobacter medicaginis]